MLSRTAMYRSEVHGRAAPVEDADPLTQQLRVIAADVLNNSETAAVSTAAASGFASSDASSEDEEVHPPCRSLAKQDWISTAAALAEYHQKNPGASFRELGVRFGVSDKTAKKYALGEVNLSSTSRGGRATLLSPELEVHILLLVEELHEQGTPLSGDHIAMIAYRAYTMEQRQQGHEPNPSVNPGSFTKDWRRRMNVRHPDLAFSLKASKPMDVSRQEASTLNNVLSHANKIKMLFRDVKGGMSALGQLLHRKLNEFEIPSSMIWTLDETCLNAEKDIGSDVHFAVPSGQAVAMQTTCQTSGHISAVGMVCADGRSEFALIMAGSPTTPRDRNITPYRIPVIYNESGSARQGSVVLKEDGSVERFELGSFDVVLLCWLLQRLVEQPDIYARPWIILEIDGHASHESWFVHQLLCECRVSLVRIHSQMTHLIQVNDHANIHGFLKRQQHEWNRRMTELNDHVPMDFYQHPYILENLLCASYTVPNIIATFSSMGMYYSPNLATVLTDDEHIENWGKSLQSSGLLTAERDKANASILRPANLIASNRLAKAGVLPPGAVLPSARALQVATHVADSAAASAIHGRSHSLVKSRAISLPTGGLMLDSYTTVVNSAERNEARLQIMVNVLKEGQDKESRLQEREAKSLLKKQAADAVEERLQRLNERLTTLGHPALTAESRRRVGRYTTGNSEEYNLEWALRLLTEKATPASSRAAATPTATIKRLEDSSAVGQLAAEPSKKRGRRTPRAFESDSSDDGEWTERRVVR